MKMKCEKKDKKDKNDYIFISLTEIDLEFGVVLVEYEVILIICSQHWFFSIKYLMNHRKKV